MRLVCLESVLIRYVGVESDSTYLTVNKYCMPSIGSPSKSSGRRATGSILLPARGSSSSSVSFKLLQGRLSVAIVAVQVAERGSLLFVVACRLLALKNA